MFRWVYRQIKDGDELNGALPVGAEGIVQVLQIQVPASVAKPNKLSLVGVHEEQEDVWVDVPCDGFEGATDE